MKIDGGCHCGHVTYEADVDPERVSICHCVDCQRLTGSPFRVTVATGRDDVRLTGQEPKTYVRYGDSGAKRYQMFCPECGSPVFVTGEGEAARVWGIRWGSVNQRDRLVPRRQIWCRSAVDWLGEIASLPASDRG